MSKVQKGKEMNCNLCGRKLTHRINCGGDCVFCMDAEGDPDADRMINDIIDEWHETPGLNIALHDYLGLSREEYSQWLSKCIVQRTA